MTTFIICLVVLGAGLIALRVYFEEKQKKDIEKQNAEIAEKTNEQVVAERLEEIAKFESEVNEKTSIAIVNPVTPVIEKPKAKKKKYYAPKKQQPKIKAK